MSLLMFQFLDSFKSRLKQSQHGEVGMIELNRHRKKNANPRCRGCCINLVTNWCNLCFINYFESPCLRKLLLHILNILYTT